MSGSADKDVKFWEFEEKPADSENVRITGLVFPNAVPNGFPAS